MASVHYTRGVYTVAFCSSFVMSIATFSHHETSQETSTRHSRSFREPSRTAAAALGPAGRCASEAGRLRSSAKSGGAWPEAMPLSAGRGTSPHSGTSRLCGTRKGGTTRGCASFGPAWHLAAKWPEVVPRQAEWQHGPRLCLYRPDAARAVHGPRLCLCRPEV